MLTKDSSVMTVTIPSTYLLGLSYLSLFSFALDVHPRWSSDPIVFMVLTVNTSDHLYHDFLHLSVFLSVRTLIE